MLYAMIPILQDCPIDCWPTMSGKTVRFANASNYCLLLPSSTAKATTILENLLGQYTMAGSNEWVTYCFMWSKENSGWFMVSCEVWMLWLESSNELSIAKADWYPALPKLAWSEQAYPH